MREPERGRHLTVWEFHRGRKITAHAADDMRTICGYDVVGSAWHGPISNRHVDALTVDCRRCRRCLGCA